MRQDRNLNVKVLDSSTKQDEEYPLVKMDFGQFEKNFQVLSDNKIDTYRLLTLDVMELLLEYKERYKIKFDITFYDSTIYYRLHTGALFEASMNSKGMQKESFYKYYMSLNLIKELSKKTYEIFSELE